jgi:hypothetical protein
MGLFDAIIQRLRKISLLDFHFSRTKTDSAAHSFSQQYKENESVYSDVRIHHDPDHFQYDYYQQIEVEISEQVRISALYKEQWREYLIEENNFRKRFHKSCKCDVCGVFNEELLLYKNQTYCVRHLPVERSVVVRKITAGRHGSSRDYLKRIP